ncbi:MAG: DUF1648 domain-containing protein [Bacillota bacterium]
MIQRNKTSVIIFIFVNLLMAFEFIYFYPLLPDKMATHFNFSGNADGWAGKTPFFMIFVFIYFISIGSMLLLSFFINKIPNSMINLPNKDKLLAPERREVTLSYISKFLIDLASLTALLFIFLNYFVFVTNINNKHSLPLNAMYVVGLFVILVFILVYKMFIRLKDSKLKGI